MNIQLVYKIKRQQVSRSCLLIFVLISAWLPCNSLSQISLQGNFRQYRPNQSSGSESQAEMIFVHTDRPIYVSGENLWFKVYCRFGDHGLPTALSQAAYIELIDAENQQVAAQVIHLISGSGNGAIEIPANLESGVYYLLAYTAWMKNTGPVYYFQKNLKIYNPFSGIPHDQPVADSANMIITRYGSPVPSDSAPTTAIMNLVLENLLQQYKNRDRVSLRLKLKGPPGTKLSSDLSVAVVLDDAKKTETGAESQGQLQMIIPGNARLSLVLRVPPPDSIYLPEKEGLLLSGWLKNKSTGMPEANMEVYLSCVGGNRDVKLTHTNSNGRFFFRLPEGEGKRQIIVQAPAVTDENLLVIDNQFARRSESPHQVIFDLSEFAKDYLEQVLFNYQVRVAYKIVEKRTAENKSGIDFFGKPDEQHALDKYIKLPVMEEFFRELVKSTILTREEGSYRINVLDRNLNRIIGPNPGYLIDGVPVFQPGVILESDPQVFSSIRVISSRYLYGNLMWDGIIDISSRAGDFSDFELPPASVRQTIQLFEPDREYIAVRYDTSEPYKDKLPDYRTVLLWKPDLTTDLEGMTHFEFTTSDVSGRYKIVIQGITASGQQIHFEKRFIVGEN